MHWTSPLLMLILSTVAQAQVTNDEDSENSYVPLKNDQPNIVEVQPQQPNPETQNRVRYQSVPSSSMMRYPSPYQTRPMYNAYPGGYGMQQQQQPQYNTLPQWPMTNDYWNRPSYPWQSPVMQKQINPMPEPQQPQYSWPASSSGGYQPMQDSSLPNTPTISTFTDTDNGFYPGSPNWRKSFTPSSNGCFNRCRPSCGYNGNYNYGCRPSCRSSCNIRPSCGSSNPSYYGNTMVCSRNSGYYPQANSYGNYAATRNPYMRGGQANQNVNPSVASTDASG